MSAPALHYGAERVVLFEEEGHVYTIDGVVSPSVTQIISPICDYSMVPAGILEYKASLGSAVHAGCELVAYNALDEDDLDPLLVGYIAAFKLFLADTGFQIEETEQAVVSTRHGFAIPGRMDLVGKFAGWRWIIDIKTVTVLQVAPAKLQTAAYRMAYNETAPQSAAAVKRGALVLRPEGTYKLYKFENHAADEAAFLALKTIHDWRALNG